MPDRQRENDFESAALDFVRKVTPLRLVLGDKPCLAQIFNRLVGRPAGYAVPTWTGRTQVAIGGGVEHVVGSDVEPFDAVDLRHLAAGRIVWRLGARDVVRILDVDGLVARLPFLL